MFSNIFLYNEDRRLDVNVRFLEMLEEREKITVGEAKEFESFIRSAYEIAYGPIFGEDDKDNDVKEIYDGPHK